MTSRKELISALSTYSSTYQEEHSFRDQFLELLQHPRCYCRDHLPGHITGSAFIIDQDFHQTLLTHHAKLNKWLQPGGHADGDENILNVALREAEEETGLKSPLLLIGEGIFDIDIHVIPARKDFPEHFHYDIRFLFQASDREPIMISDESHDLAWKKIDDLPSLTANNFSMVRMAEKTRALLRSNK